MRQPTRRSFESAKLQAKRVVTLFRDTHGVGEQNAAATARYWSGRVASTLQAIRAVPGSQTLGTGSPLTSTMHPSTLIRTSPAALTSGPQVASVLEEFKQVVHAVCAT